MKYTIAFVVAAVAGISYPAAAVPVDWSKLPPAAKAESVTFEKDIQPLFKASCVQCHGADRPKARLRLDSLEGVLKGTKSGPVLKSGDSAKSLLVKAVSQLDPETAMPPKPRVRRGAGGPQGTNAPALQPRKEGGSEQGEREHDNEDHGRVERTAGSPQGTNAPAQRPRNFGPPAKPLTAEQVGLVRAWIDQGAK